MKIPAGLIATLTLLIMTGCSQPELTDLQELNTAYIKQIHYSTPAFVEIMPYLETGQYAELDAMFAEFEERFQDDPSAEYSFIQAYAVFADIGRSDYPPLMSQLTAWIDTTGSAMAYTARGFFLAGEGFRFRGTRYLDAVPEQDLADARIFWSLALGDLREAVRLNPGMTPAYQQIIGVAAQSGKRTLRQQTFEAAIKAVPHSYQIRQMHAFYMQPRWGGSYEDAELIADQAVVHAGRNPHLWRLHGDILDNQAYDCITDKDYSCAIERYTEAMKFGSTLSRLQRRAFSYYSVGQYDAALQDIETAIAMNPEGPASEAAMRLMDWIREHQNNQAAGSARQKLRNLSFWEFSEIWQ